MIGATIDVIEQAVAGNNGPPQLAVWVSESAASIGGNLRSGASDWSQ